MKGYDTVVEIVLRETEQLDFRFYTSLSTTCLAYTSGTCFVILRFGHRNKQR